MKSYGGLSVIYLPDELVEELHEKRIINIIKVVGAEGQSVEYYPDDMNKDAFTRLVVENASFVVKGFSGAVSSALAMVIGDELQKIHDYQSKSSVFGINARNKEQNFALNALMDPDIHCVVIEGAAGVGKTFVTLAAAMEQSLERKTYEKVIFTRPMSSVGASLGALPGNADEKFSPYLENYFSNLEVLGMKRSTFEAYRSRKLFEFVPLQLIGGVSWRNSFIIADEIQTLTDEQFYALGSRVAEGSKLVLLGDIAQRYGKKCPPESTGLYQFVNSHIVQNSDLVATIKLIKQERSGLVSVFYDCFFGKHKDDE